MNKEIKIPKLTKYLVDKAKSLLKNAPNWREDLATESEADVRKNK